MYCPVCMLPDRSRKAKRWRPCSRHNILRETTVIICSMRRKWIKTKLLQEPDQIQDHLLELTRQGTAEMHMIFEENKETYDPV